MKETFEIKNKRFLVTGGTGFIGSGLIAGLLKSGGIVRSLDNDSRGARRKLGVAAEQIEIVTGDVRDPAIVRKAIAGMDCVCHLAYINGTEFFYEKPDVILEVAVKGMMNVLDACLAEGVKKIILASSSEVYQLPPFIPTDESVPLIVPDVLNPRYSYGGGKIISELLLVNYGRKFFDRAIIFRPHNVYGPDMGWEHVIPQFALRMKKCFFETEGTVDFPIQGNGDETRAFIYIDDFVTALLRVIEKGEHLNIYHIGTNQEISIRELAEMTARCFKREIRIIPGQLMLGSTPRRCPDVSKLSGLGFTPQVDLASGLVRTVSWYMANKPS
ncbi:MAG: NAD(P)-dependent oxidoreductase [Deltaproteobacteria bacterium]|nr:NAD(P)-dependent oxidoreductase [Deltaproteobacteria bacterium]